MPPSGDSRAGAAGAAQVTAVADMLVATTAVEPAAEGQRRRHGGGGSRGVGAAMPMRG